MFVFSVASNTQNAELNAKIREVYPSEHFQFGPMNWFVADSGVTAREVCEKLNIVPGGFGGVAVTKVESYFGFAPSALWDWLKSRTSVI
ncbi:MAG TPA: hypothetical protein VIF34_00300 [Methylocystis sp.]|jgi:hypothetical protein